MPAVLVGPMPPPAGHVNVLGDSTYTISRTTPYRMIDKGTSGFGIVSNLSSPIKSVQVDINITHPRVSSLQLYLIAPNGSRYNLASFKGGMNTSMVASFTDNAAAVMSTSSNGSFKPENSFSTLVGKSLPGTWKIMAYDNTAGSIGTINSFSITFTY